METYGVNGIRQVVWVSGFSMLNGDLLDRFNELIHIDNASL
jgi:hypothetical protein